MPNGSLTCAAPRHEAGSAGLLMADVDGHLGGVRSRNQIRRAEKIDEVLAREPARPTHHLVLHHPKGDDITGESWVFHLLERVENLLRRDHVPSRPFIWIDDPEGLRPASFLWPALRWVAAGFQVRQVAKVFDPYLAGNLDGSDLLPASHRISLRR